MSNVIPLEVNISDILDDDYFRVSRKKYPDSLPLSLKMSGMLEAPWLVKKSNGYIPVTCHNRIGILRGTGTGSLKCCVLDKPDAEIFMNHVSLKSYRNELGPAGKLKSLMLLKDSFEINDGTMNEFCKKILKLPVDVIKDRRYIEHFFLLQSQLIEYLDEKDVNFKTIRDLINLPSDWVNVLSNWIKRIQIRMNVFKGLVEHLFDIYRRGDAVTVIDTISCSDEKTLYDEVYKIRFPGYVKLKMKSDVIMRKLTCPGISIDFPEYFDRNYVAVKLAINKTHDSRSQLKKISSLDPETLNELLSLL